MEMLCGEHDSNYCNKRFDFGVPLEDIFPPHDIHPRLKEHNFSVTVTSGSCLRKYLLEQTYYQYKKRNFDTGQLLRGPQVPLEKHLKLKETLISKINYRNYIYEQPETYFWVIRHFLGLLPISLLPKYSSGLLFNWEGLAKDCQHTIRYLRRHGDEKNKLDYRISKYLKNLPAEHFIMFNFLVIFIREISQSFTKPSQLNRHTLLCLVKYYCGSIFTRPYRPGSNDTKDIKMIHLLLYVIIRWYKIEKYFEGNETSKLSRTSCHKYDLFNAKILTFQQNMSCSHCKIYLKDEYSQTEEKSEYSTESYITDAPEKNNFPCEDTAKKYFHIKNTDKKYIQNEDIDKNNLHNKDTEKNNVLIEGREKHDFQHGDIEKNNCYNDESDLNPSKENLSPIPENSLSLNTDYNESPKNQTTTEENKETSINHNEDEKVDEAELTFPSSIDTSNHVEWRDVVKETLETVKKVDEYIYDDYETFRKEDYNQISSGEKNSSILSEMFRTVWLESTPKKSQVNMEDFKVLPDPDETYLKYPDVFTEENMSPNSEFHTTDNFGSKDGIFTGAFRSYANSNECLCSSRLKELPDSTNKGDKNKTNFNLKRFKMKLHFLRVFTPNKTANFSGIFNMKSNVKYKKIHNIKSFTL